MERKKIKSPFMRHFMVKQYSKVFTRCRACGIWNSDLDGSWISSAATRKNAEKGNKLSARRLALGAFDFRNLNQPFFFFLSLLRPLSRVKIECHGIATKCILYTYPFYMVYIKTYCLFITIFIMYWMEWWFCHVCSVCIGNAICNRLW